MTNARIVDTRVSQPGRLTYNKLASLQIHHLLPKQATADIPVSSVARDGGRNWNRQGAI